MVTMNTYILFLLMIVENDFSKSSLVFEFDLGTFSSMLIISVNFNFFVFFSLIELFCSSPNSHPRLKKYQCLFQSIFSLFDSESSYNLNYPLLVFQLISNLCCQSSYLIVAKKDSRDML